jgi:hypothetical protein
MGARSWTQSAAWPTCTSADAKAFVAFLAPLRRTKWFVYSKRPFAGPKAVLAYLARYTHRVAVSNRRHEDSATFKLKDYRVKGPGRYTTMTLATAEFIRRFLASAHQRGACSLGCACRLMPVLWRAHDHHRHLRGGLPT